MMDNYGFRINKYLKVSLVIGLIDLLIFYIVGKNFKYMNLFHIIIDNWKYAFLFIGSILLIIYLFDVLFFYNRNKKYKFLLIFDEPFKKWQTYIKEENIINKKHKINDFYSDIYCKVKDVNKIQGIMDDEILIRDIAVHLISTNLFILLVFFILEQVKIKICLYCLTFIILIYIILNISYRNYLKYFITEIYSEYINLKNIYDLSSK